MKCPWKYSRPVANTRAVSVLPWRTFSASGPCPKVNLEHCDPSFGRLLRQDSERCYFKRTHVRIVTNCFPSPVHLHKSEKFLGHIQCTEDQQKWRHVLFISHHASTWKMSPPSLQWNSPKIAKTTQLNKNEKRNTCKYILISTSWWPATLILSYLCENTFYVGGDVSSHHQDVVLILG